MKSLIAWPVTRDVKDFRQFYIEHRDAIYFPGNLDQVFTNLEVVVLWDSKVKFVDNFDLRWLTNLKILSMPDNQIEVLQSDLFFYNTLLTEVHLQNNKLKFLGARIFVPLMRLRILNLRDNICVDERADSPATLEVLLRKSLDEKCAAPEFLVKKNSEFITKFVDLNYTIAELNSNNSKLITEVKTSAQSLLTCEIEKESLSDQLFKVEMKLRKESSALKKCQKELKITKESNVELTIENVKLNSELKRVAEQVAEDEKNLSDLLLSNDSNVDQDSSTGFHRLKFDNAKLVKENQLLKSFKEEIEREWRAVELQCQFVLWDGYACQTSSLKIRTDDSEIVKVDGKHEGRRTNFNVKRFLISSQEVRTTFLPVNIGSTFPKLETLIAQDSKIIFIKRGNFDNLISLTILALDHNDIAEVPSDALNDLENLVQLDISFNRLVTLDKATFNSLKKLKLLALNDNKIEKLSASIFKSNLQLEIVALENNKIKYIGSSILKPLVKLKLVNLLNNECISGKFTAQTVNEVETRILSHCTPPTDIYCQFVDGYTCRVVDLLIENENTMILDVKGNHQRGKSDSDVTEILIVDQSVSNFPLGFGKFLKNVKRIVVQKSKLASIDDNSFELGSIEQLTLAENEIKFVSEDAFQKVKSSIEVIDLSANKISNFELRTFNNLIKLKVLKLTGNKLGELNSNLLVQNVNLEELHVGKNKLRSIGARLMNNLKKLKIADFSGNPCINENFPHITLQTLKLKILEQCQ